MIYLLIDGKNRDSKTFAAGQEVPWEVSLPGFGIGMINDDFHMAGIRQVVAGRLKRAVMYSMALGPRCFKWKMLSLLGPKAILSIPLIVLHSLVTSVFWSMVSTWSLRFCRLCTQMRFWMVLFNLGSSGEVGSLLRRSSRLFITSSIYAGTASSWSLWRPVGMWCDAALSRTVRKIFSSLWQSVGRERLLRAASTTCLYLSQLAFLG